MTDTCTHLERYDPARGMARFYALSVRPNLFGGWSVMREWGRVGSPGRVRIDLHESEGEAQAAYGKLVRQKQRRGYI